jgi:hypothetical protein
MLWSLAAVALAGTIPSLPTAGSPLGQLDQAAGCALEAIGTALDLPPIVDGERLIARDGLLYALGGDGFVIARIEHGEAVELAGLELAGRPESMWLDGDRAVIVGTAAGRGATARLAVVDIADPEHPDLVIDETIDGVLRGGRVANGRIVLVTGGGHGPGNGAATDVLAPLGVDGCDVALPTQDPWSAVTVRDLAHPKRELAGGRLPDAADLVAFDGDTVWVGASGRPTRLVRVGPDGGITAHIDVPGAVPSSHHLDVRDGVVTAVFMDDARATTVATWTTDGMPLGSLGGLGPGEVLAASKIVDGRAYVVTVDGKALDPDDPIQAARQAMVRPKDPLFVVDLTDPAAPRELGRLELPGWSDLLLPIGDGRLLATGVDKHTPVVSLFDVSDPTRPTLASRVDLPKLDPSAREDFPSWAWDAESHTLALPTIRGIALVDVGDALALREVVAGHGGAPDDAVIVGGQLFVIDANGETVALR